MTQTFSSFSSKKEYAKAPAGIYGILGNDYSPVIFKKGEIKPIEIMARNEEFVKVFKSINTISLSTVTNKVIEEFVCWRPNTILIV